MQYIPGQVMHMRVMQIRMNLNTYRLSLLFSDPCYLQMLHISQIVQKYKLQIYVYTMAAMLANHQLCTCTNSTTRNIELSHTLILDLCIWVRIWEGPKLQYRFLNSRHFFTVFFPYFCQR